MSQYTLVESIPLSESGHSVLRVFKGIRGTRVALDYVVDPSQERVIDHKLTQKMARHAVALDRIDPDFLLAAIIGLQKEEGVLPPTAPEPELGLSTEELHRAILEGAGIHKPAPSREQAARPATPVESPEIQAKLKELLQLLTA